MVIGASGFLVRVCIPRLVSSLNLIFPRRRRYRLRPRSPLANSASAPGVSVLRPLKGLDANLYENLESTFTQEYSNYEIIFSVANEDDQALPIVRALVSKYPNIQTTVIVGKKTTYYPSAAYNF